MILGGVALAFGVWYSLSPSSSSQVLSASSTTGPGQEVVDTLRQLDAVKLDGGIFSEPAFSALRDFSTQIVPEPVGRPNPFAPLGRSAPIDMGTSSQVFSPGGRP